MVGEVKVSVEEVHKPKVGQKNDVLVVDKNTISPNKPNQVYLVKISEIPLLITLCNFLGC